MKEGTPLYAVLLFVLAATLVVETNATKAKNQTVDECFKPCRVRSSPVCGNDGRNYSSGCAMSVARCRARKIGQRLFAVNTGYCRSSKPASQCRLNCTERREPVCGSDQVTYKNLCQFKKAKCIKRKNKEPAITIVSRRGPCVKKASSCRTLASCPKVRKPVCGSNDVTYKNICHLKTTNCRQKRSWERAQRKTRNAAMGKKYTKITLKHWGACGRAKQCKWQKCPEVKFCNQLLRAAVRFAEVKNAAESKKKPLVPRVSKKKTASGKTKNQKQTSSKKSNSKKNSARKKTAEKSNNVPKKPNPKSKTGQTSKTGKTGQPGKASKSGKTGKTGKTGKKSGKKLEQTGQTNKKTSKRVIPKLIYEVCGSDGKTYPSICHLQVEQCSRLSRCGRLQMRHKGACKKRTGKS